MSAPKQLLFVGSCGELAEEIGRVLRNAGVVVKTAATAAEGLAVHETEKVDLVVTDLDLPDSTAERLCDAIRADERLRAVSVIVVCGADEPEMKRAADCRANAHVIRPTDAETFATEVKRLLGVSLRTSYRVLVRVEPEGGRAFFCTSENLSAAGMLVETPGTLAVGRAIACSFFLPGGKRLSARGRVAREAPSVTGKAYGIEFLGLSRLERSTIGAFVEQRRKLR